MTSGHEYTRRIEDILTRAEQLLGNERSSFLAESCAGDAALRRELEQRLASDSALPEPASLLDSAPQGPADDTARELLKRVSRHTPLQSRYEIRGEIARGGMGSILRVWDGDLRRHLAMKVVLGQGQPGRRGDTPEVEPKLLARFLEEAQVTSQLDHPGIVPVHELGLDSEGGVYFTMKLVKGRTLKQVFDELARGQGGWTQARVLGLIQKVCEAMSYAHAKGVIHRDLKPANVMVGRFGEVYVMDWGLAKILGREDEKDLSIRARDSASVSVIRSDRAEHAGDTPDSPLYTMDGDVVGTPAYMSPEQAMGSVSEMGPPSDVYAVGAMLYHLLAGHMPYVEPGSALHNYAVWHAVQTGPPRALHSIAPAAAAELVAICEQAMSRETSTRYPDMAALAEDLSAYIEGRVVRAYETGTWAEARKWMRRNRLLVGAAGLALVSLVLGLAGTLRYASRARAELVERRRFSDTVLVRDLVAQVDDLWPRRERRVAALDAWIARADSLVQARADYEGSLVRVRAEIETSGASASGLHAGPQQAVAPVDSDLRFRLETLEDLVGGIDQLARRLPEIRARREYATRIHAESVERWSFEWEAARRAIAASPQYRGLDLPPQVGLVPLGPDDDSGLWEFWHYESGAQPERDPDTDRIALEVDTGLVLVLIPGGRAHLGAQRSDPDAALFSPRAKDEERVHEAELPAFLLAKYELNQAQWQRLAGRNPSRWAPDTQTFVATTLLHPVEEVSWVDCRTLLGRYELRLPSEDEWEWAARAGTLTPWWTGEDPASLDGATNLRDVSYSAHWEGAATWERALDDGYPAHAPVDAFEPNPFGLYGVIGNVMEWCADRHHEDSTASSSADLTFDPRDPGNRVLRGGGWASLAEDVRSSSRTPYGAVLADTDCGVRPARSLQPDGATNPR